MADKRVVQNLPREHHIYSYVGSWGGLQSHHWRALSL